MTRTPRIGSDGVGWTRAVMLAGMVLIGREIAFADGSTTVEKQIVEVHEEIRRATTELNKVRDSVAAKRRALTDDLRAVEEQVVPARQEAERLRRVRRQTQAERETLEREVRRLAEECAFIHTLLSEYRRSFSTRVGPAELTLMAPDVARIDEALAVDERTSGLGMAGGAVLDLAERLNRLRFGGMQFAGSALDVAGVERQGRYAVFGPAAYFHSDGAAGPVVVRLGSVLPSVREGVEAAGAAALDALTRGEAVDVAVDVTGGDALRISEVRRTPLQAVRRGGIIMVPLGLVGLVALVVAVRKLLEFRRMGPPPVSAMDTCVSGVKEGHVEDAEVVARGAPEPWRAVLLAAVAHHGVSREHLEEMLHEHILALIPRLERHLGTLAVCAGVAPLLGLLGTVTGMIHTFELVTVFGTGDARLLSGGISEALITTEVGLAIAIPALITHAYLARRVRTCVADLETLGERVAQGMKRGNV